MIKHLEERLGSWIILFILATADNGMPFPYAKANVQEYGTHVPLAISLPGGVKNKVEKSTCRFDRFSPNFNGINGDECGHGNNR